MAFLLYCGSVEMCIQKMQYQCATIINGQRSPMWWSCTWGLNTKLSEDSRYWIPLLIWTLYITRIHKIFIQETWKHSNPLEPTIRSLLQPSLAIQFLPRLAHPAVVLRIKYRLELGSTAERYHQGWRSPEFSCLEALDWKPRHSVRKRRVSACPLTGKIRECFGRDNWWMRGRKWKYPVIR